MNKCSILLMVCIYCICVAARVYDHLHDFFLLSMPLRIPLEDMWQIVVFRSHKIRLSTPSLTLLLKLEGKLQLCINLFTHEFILGTKYRNSRLTYLKIIFVSLYHLHGVYARLFYSHFLYYLLNQLKGIVLRDFRHRNSHDVQLTL